MSKQLNNLFPYLGFEDKTLITNDGYMSLFFSASLYDKDSLGLDDKYEITSFLRDVFETLNADILIQQYFIKHEASKLNDLEYACQQSKDLAEDHIRFINMTQSYESRLIWVISYKTDFIKKSSSFSLISLFIKFLLRKCTFEQLQKEIDIINETIVSETRLIGHLNSFHELISRFQNQIINNNDYFKFDVLSNHSVIGFLSFLATYDSKYLDSDIQFDESISLSLPTPDIDMVSIANATCLRHKNATHIYSSIGSIIRFIGKTKPEFWTHKKSDIISLPGEFIIYTAFKPYSQLQKATTFHAAKVKTEQITHNPIKRIIRQGQIDLEKDNPVVYERLQKLNEARNWDISYGEGIFALIPFSKDPDMILPMRSKLDSSVLSSSGRMVWETHGLMTAYHSLMPTGIDYSARKLKINSHQYAALSLCYTQQSGLDEVKLLEKDRPLCYFQTPAKERFSFSPYVGQQSLIIGVGETRGGKTFLKNFISSMMMSWGAKASFLDIDEGSYPIATHFDGQSSIYDLPDYSYNPFDDYLPGVNENIFHEHILNLFNLIANSPLEVHEKEYIERSLSSLFKMPDKMHDMEHLISMLPAETQQKFDQFLNGINESFFSSAKTKRLSNINCFNLERVYELKSLSALSYYTLIFQIINDFKFRTPKHIPKYLWIDEAHTPLEVKAIQHMVDNISRTGNKYLIGLGLFTQNAYELGKLDFWPALRTACSTLLFVSNPDIDDDHYKNTFKLTDYELSEIKSLIPRKEFYLIQREANISKRLEFNPSPYYAHNFSSNPIHNSKLRAVK